MQEPGWWRRLSIVWLWWEVRNGFLHPGVRACVVMLPTPSDNAVPSPHQRASRQCTWVAFFPRTLSADFTGHSIQTISDPLDARIPFVAGGLWTLVALVSVRIWGSERGPPARLPHTTSLPRP